MADAEILERVVALNAARAAEEAKGVVRWLRPDYQKPLLASSKQSSLDLGSDGLASGLGNKSNVSGRTKIFRKAKVAWPKSLADRVRVVETALAGEGRPATAAALAKRFARAKPNDIAEILHTLVTLGRARAGDLDGTFVR